MEKNMKKVWIAPGCITCGRCEFIAPEVFEVSDVAHVKDDIDPARHASAIQEAAKTCPVQVIKYALQDKNGPD
jgi:ferredoxin